LADKLRAPKATGNFIGVFGSRSTPWRDESDT